MSESVRIVILGGGFGGLYTALRLDEFPWEGVTKPEILLIDRGDRFLFSPLLYEWITQEMQAWEIAPPFAELLSGTGIQFLQQSVTGIDLEAKRVELGDRPPLAYDRLVLALGGKTPVGAIPGVKDHAFPFKTLEDAYRLGEKLRVLESCDPEKIRVAVVGGGYSGVEIACKLADRLGESGRIRLIERGDHILASSPDFNRKTAEKALERHKIWIDLETEVERVEADALTLKYKGQSDRIPVDIVVWTVGLEVAPWIRDLPLPQGERGLIATNPYLQAGDRPEVYVLGDLADCRDASGQKVPATAQAAFQQSDYCAWNLWAGLTQRPLLPFRFQNLGEMMTLGGDNATLAGSGIQVDGIVAHIARRLIYLYRLPTWQHRLNVGVKWMLDPLTEGLR